MTAPNSEKQEPGPDRPEDPSDYTRLLQFLDGCPIGLVEFAGDGTVIHLNPAVVRMLTALVGGALECTNVFDMFGDLWPDMADRMSETTASYMVVDDHRVAGSVQGVRCWWSLSVVRVAADRYTMTAVDVTRSAQAEHALAQREAELQSVFASIDEGFCVCQMILDETGKAIDYRFESVNLLFEQMTGLVDPVGRTALELIPDLEVRWIEAYAKVALLGETLRFEQGSDALGRWFDVFATPIGSAGRFAIVFKDQTAKREADHALKQTARLNGFRAQLVDSLRNATDAAMLQGRSAELLGELLDAARVHYAEFDATVSHGVVRADYCGDGISSVVGTHRLDDFGPEVMNAVRAGFAVRIHNTATDARLDDSHRAATNELGIGAYAIVPVLRMGRPVAGIDRPSPRPTRVDRGRTRPD